MEGKGYDLGNGSENNGEALFQQGEKSGKQKGEKIGERKKALEIAEALRKKGMSEAEIAEVTGLPEQKETLK